MEQVRFSKVEMSRLNLKLNLFKKYLPILKLKKSLLLQEVESISSEINKKENIYKELIAKSKEFSKLLTDNTPSLWKESLQGSNIVSYESFLGIRFVAFEKVDFKPYIPCKYDPVWVEILVDKLRHSISAKREIGILLQKQDILLEELRSVSIRVNLLEKRLVPSLLKKISQIKIMLGDQELQSIVRSKISKRKRLSKLLCR